MRTSPRHHHQQKQQPQPQLSIWFERPMCNTGIRTVGQQHMPIMLFGHSCTCNIVSKFICCLTLRLNIKKLKIFVLKYLKWPAVISAVYLLFFPTELPLFAFLIQGFPVTATAHAPHSYAVTIIAPTFTSATSNASYILFSRSRLSCNFSAWLTAFTPLCRGNVRERQKQVLCMWMTD